MSKSVLAPVSVLTELSVPACEVGSCATINTPDPAVRLMPRLAGTDTEGKFLWEFVLACTNHASGWWDGDDADRYRHEVVVHGYHLMSAPSPVQPPESA